MKQSGFLTPVAEAQKSGLAPYWLGPEFTAGGERFQIDGEASFAPTPNGGPGLFLSYAARRGIGGTLTINTFASDATLNDTLRQQAERVIGGQSERVAVGSWQGKLYSSPAAKRPVNQLLLFLDVNGLIVVVAANAGGSGIPGDDPNPLIVRDTLIAALTQLRPYPE